MEYTNTKTPEAAEDEKSTAAAKTTEIPVAAIAPDGDLTAQVSVNDILNHNRVLFVVEQTINKLIENCPPGPQYEDFLSLSPLFQPINGKMHFTWASETGEPAADEEAVHYQTSAIHTHFEFSSGSAGSTKIDPLGTNYAQAVLSLLKAEDHAANIAQRIGSAGFPAKRGAATIFFAVHPDIDPAGPCALESGHLDEIREIYKQLDAFLFLLFFGTQAAESKQEQGSADEDIDNDIIIKNSDFIYSQDGAYTFFTLYAVAYIMGWRPEQAAGQENAQSLQDEVLNVLPKLQSLIPQKHLIPNNKLANSLTKDIIGAGIIELDVSGKKEPELLTRCILNYEGDNVKLSSRQPFTEYDRNVADAVTSLYEYGDASHIITAAQVYRAMVHATKTETPSAQQIGAVTKSLDKMRFVRVQIDCSQELTRRKVSLNGAQVTSGKIDTYLLALEKIEVTAGGQRVSAYKIMKPPILYEYSSLTGQVLTVPAALLDVRDNTGVKVSNTELRIAAKGYLLRRISVMKGKSGARQSHTIKYSSLYEEVCPGQTLRRVEQQRLRDYTAIVLENWTWKGFISGYTETLQGNKKIGVEIKL